MDLEKDIKDLKEKQTDLEKALHYFQCMNDQRIEPVFTNQGGLPMFFPSSVSELSNDDNLKEKEEESNKVKLDNENDSSDSEEKMPDDDKYSGYDKGYCYHNKRYKKKVLPIISPIISLVII
ncbi:hypothetical protein C1645_869758 [Glomus cerebriforme]|uniref:Uncharacterized protein n=1 Tax=Glomus cerebriforme TaxID=658196 RepID=A0A397TP51_9GLOM|nr:hypothetical protein C1645_869758 [Glomus cerebriforme]